MDSRNLRAEDKRPKDSFPSSTAVRRRAFDEQMLAIKLAGPDARMELACSLGERDDLIITERRQLLIAIQRYVIASPADLPDGVGRLLNVVVRLATRSDLRYKALAIFTAVLDILKRDQVVSQLKPGLEALLRHFVPRGTKTEFTPELIVRIARKLEQQRESEVVINLVSLGLFFFPFNGPLREMRADNYFAVGNTAGARAEFDRLVEQFPERQEFRLDRAEASLRLEDYEDALEDLEAYLRQDPGNPVALKKQAEALSQSGRYLEALDVMGRLIEIEGGRIDHYLGRARIYEQVDFFDEALEDVERAFKIDKDNQEARQLRQSLIIRKQSYGMEDDLYTAFMRGDDESLLGDLNIPETRFADIGGLEEVKQAIRENIEYPHKYKELSARYGKKAGGGLLFFGPPGCGKTMLARAAAGECGVTFINVNLATVLDKWVGNSEKAVSMIFNSARKQAPSIIFLDEVDAIGGNRANMQAGWEKKLISQLLIELDGLNSENDNVMVLAASNAPWDVDFALRRPGRLGQLVFVKPPNEKERSAVIKIYLDKKPWVGDDINIDEIGRLTVNYSADALRQVVENAASIPWREAIKSGEERPIGQADLLKAVEDTPADLTEWEKLVSRYEDFAKQSLKKPGIGFRKIPPRQA